MAEIEPYVVEQKEPSPIIEVLRTLADMLQSGQYKALSGGMIVSPKTATVGGQQVTVSIEVFSNLVIGPR